MNKEIFKLEKMLQENSIPFYFNYTEENRPAPFGAVRVAIKNELLYIAIGPLTRAGFESVVVNLADETDDSLLRIRLYDNEEHQNIAPLTAEAVFEIINEQFLTHRAEWWPEVFGAAK